MLKNASCLLMLFFVKGSCRLDSSVSIPLRRFSSSHLFFLFTTHNPPSHALILFQGSACSFYRQKDEMMDLMEMSSEIEDTLCRSYNVPDGIDENVLMGELDAPEADMETEIEAVIMLSYL